MQRVCKYPLLLRELQKETPKSDPTYISIGNAMDELQQYLSKINENKRTVDNLMDLIAIQDLIVDKELNLPLSKGRALIGTKEFKKVTVDNNSPIKATLWILSDMILIAKRKDKEKYSYRGQMKTNTCVVWDEDPQGTGLLYSCLYYCRNDFNLNRICSST